MGRQRFTPLAVATGLIALSIIPIGSGCGRAHHAGGDTALPAGFRLSPPSRLASSDIGAARALERPSAILADPTGMNEIEAVVTPPVGWRPDPLKRTRSHAHQAWISPTGRTAYGVIRINLPLPFIGPDMVLPRFIEEMRRTEGEGRLLSRHRDSGLPGLRFVAEGGQYRLRANLITRGFRAWAVYAGSLRAQPEMPDEIAVAEAAREETRIGTMRVRSKNN